LSQLIFVAIFADPASIFSFFPIIDRGFWQRLSGQYKEEERLLNLLYTNERHESRLSNVQYRLFNRLFEMNHAQTRRQHLTIKLWIVGDGQKALPSKNRHRAHQMILAT